MEQREGIMKSLIVFAGIVLGAFLLGKSIERFKKEDRYISVKGFSEKEVKADLVIWSMKIRVANDDLVKGNVALASAKNKVTSFLTEKGVRAQEIVPMDLKVIDRQANEYLQPNSAQQLRYIIEETIEVRSNQVDAIQKISRMTSELLSAGIALSNKNEWGGSGLEYIFTQLNAIKPAMLSEAIKNAKGPLSNSPGKVKPSSEKCAKPARVCFPYKTGINLYPVLQKAEMSNSVILICIRRSG